MNFTLGNYLSRNFGFALSLSQTRPRCIKKVDWIGFEPRHQRPIPCASWLKSSPEAIETVILEFRQNTKTQFFLGGASDADAQRSTRQTSDAASRDETQRCRRDFESSGQTPIFCACCQGSLVDTSTSTVFFPWHYWLLLVPWKNINDNGRSVFIPIQLHIPHLT